MGREQGVAGHHQLQRLECWPAIPAAVRRKAVCPRAHEQLRHIRGGHGPVGSLQARGAACAAEQRGKVGPALQQLPLLSGIAGGPSLRA